MGDGDGAKRTPRPTVEEFTQAIIAVIFVTTTCLAIFIGRVLHRNHEVVMPPEWWALCGLVVWFLSPKTNRTKAGVASDVRRGE